MNNFTELEVSRAILDAYHSKFRQALECDVVIVGAGPAGLVAAWLLAKANRHVVILEKRLSPGGGIWGGSLGMNEVVVQKEAVSILDEIGVRYQASGNLFTADAAELASALCLKALQAGATLLNLMFAEDICIRKGRVNGVVANRTMLGDSLPIDPIVFSAKAVIDATGHEAVMVNCLCRRNLIESEVPDGHFAGEGPMDAPAGERFVVDNTSEFFPGVWTAGMSVCASHGGPRMGPIFGGMLLSGRTVAAQVIRTLDRHNKEVQV